MRSKTSEILLVNDKSLIDETQAKRRTNREEQDIAEIKITTSGLNKFICSEERRPFQGALKLSDAEC